MKTRIFSLVCLFLFVVIFPLNASTNSKEKLKAVLVVGPQEDLTASAIRKLTKIGRLLEANQIEVKTFYDKKANWNKIVEEAQDCSFFIYSGHGSTMGENGSPGGLCLANDAMISTSEMLKKLRFKDNAMVLFQSVCYGAGSSAGDPKDIGIKEAEKRVTSYANPFFEMGAVAYYANNFDDGVYDFLKEFLQGKTIYDSYLTTTTPWAKIEFEKDFPKNKTKFFSIASHKGNGTSTVITYINGKKSVKTVPSGKGYEIAFVGEKDFAFKDMAN